VTSNVIKVEDTIDSEEFCKLWNAAVIIQRVWRNYLLNYQEVESEIYLSEYENEDDDESNYEDDHII